jgi:hypothetical protein
MSLSAELGVPNLVGGALGYVELKVDGELLYRNHTENDIT